jgi:hypothetical protein
VTRSRHIRRPRRRWTVKKLALLRREYPRRPTIQVARMTGHSVPSVYNQAGKQGLHKSAEYLASPAACRLRRGDNVGAAHRFKPGLTPWNKGLHYVAGGRSAETRFKKGRPAHESPNYLPIGSLRITKDGQVERKMTDNRRIVPARRWTPVSRLVWIEHRGKIPRGHVVAFKAGRKTTEIKKITIGALECIPRAELARRNRMWVRYPKAVAQVIHLAGQLRRRIRQREARVQEHH